jgi:hypothetical protein
MQTRTHARAHTHTHRPGSIAAILLHWFPSSFWALRSVMSSSSVQASFLRSGLRWFTQRSRHWEATACVDVGARGRQLRLALFELGG